MPELLTSPTVLASFRTTETTVTTMEGTRADYTSTTGVGVPLEEMPEINEQADATQWALDWLASDAAKEYEGRWVALGRDLTVHANGSSPSALRKAVAQQGDLVILYVIPENVRLVGGGWLVARP